MNKRKTDNPCHLHDSLAPEKHLFFYHPDHLGSSSWITYTDGEAIQHLHYLPFGESFVDQRISSFASRYTFSDKEKDVETGYGYFGARYYSSDLSIWLSVDPMSDKYPSMSAYVYCANNPIMLVDPNGEEVCPYYDINGNFLGNDETGFRGKIYITTKEAFNASAKNGIADSKTLQADKRTQSIDKHIVLSPEAESKIITHILQDMSDISLSKLYHGKVSVLESTRGKGTEGIGYNDPSPCTARLRQESTVNGLSKVTVKSGELNSLGTVEAVKSYVGIHEYKSHGLLKIEGGKKNEQHAYTNQYKHWTYKYLSSDQKIEIKNRMRGIY